MLNSFKSVLHSTLHAQDGKIGHLDDVLFDDETWTSRYLVVKTGGLLKRKRVLISPLGIADMDWKNNCVHLRLTREQIEASPDVDSDRPVFRQMEKQYFDYYDWPYYWDDVSFYGIDPRNSLLIGDHSEMRVGGRSPNGASDGDPHLRSCRILIRYAIEAGDARFGHVEDFLLEDDSWKIKHLVVDTKNRWPSRPVMIETKNVESIDWPGQCVRMVQSKHEIEASPKYSAKNLHVGISNSL